ncbi:hypothetical protein K652_14992 [Pseudomonas aeruginosa VRFPA02]|nr:hypothetical protein K652_14992 [Pseudomonas aeruginosa VRFPA02]
MQVGALDRRGSLPVGLQGDEARLDVRLAELPGSEQRGIGLLQQFAGGRFEAEVGSGFDDEMRHAGGPCGEWGAGF